jgi:hypothetical protein
MASAFCALISINFVGMDQFSMTEKSVIAKSVSEAAIYKYE